MSGFNLVVVPGDPHRPDEALTASFYDQQHEDADYRRNNWLVDQVEIVTPSLSILAEPPVAVVDKVAAKHGTKELAQAYLAYLYSAPGQEIAAKHYFRPRDAAAAKAFAQQFPKIETFTVDKVFGLALDELPDNEPGLWEQPLHSRLSTAPS
jgi:ABC-type Fe3+ transport system substrate-binding protein